MFESLHHKYKRETSVSYERFASAWAERVLEERRKEINGETFLNLRLKTIKMLYEEHDRRYIIEDTINDMTVEDRQRLHSLNRQQRDARLETEALPAVRAEPYQYPRPMGDERVAPCFPAITSFGCSLPGAPPPPGVMPAPFLMPTAAAAPWVVMPPLAPLPLLREVNLRFECFECGLLKGQHPSSREFGRGKCPHVNCKCGRPRVHHQDPFNPAGPHCPLPPLPPLT